MHKSAIVIGAGIAGLAAARTLAMKGYQVKIFERSLRSAGASVRNFGMIWPIGQPEGTLYERALQSKSIWKQIGDEAKIWYEETGSLHVAYAADEHNVLQEFAELTQKTRHCELLTPAETLKKSPVIVEDKLQGSLFSKAEMIVDPRKAIPQIALYLQEKYNVEFLWGKVVTEIHYPAVYCNNETHTADEIFVCSGQDFETLYPEIYAVSSITKCKLQMMRMAVNEKIGPSLCGALSLIHYKSFSIAPSLNTLKKRFAEELPEHLQWGIHVMVSQIETGELTIGDSHEYGLMHEPFNKNSINQLILDYLKTFAHFKNETIIETWNGIYPKLTNEQDSLVLQPESGVTIINGLGGGGMTMAFGLCESIMNNL